MPSLLEAIKIKAYLCEKAPLEIVDLIMDLAEYWIHTTISMASPKAVTCAAHKQKFSTWLSTWYPPSCQLSGVEAEALVRTQPLASHVRPYRCRKIIFNISGREENMDDVSRNNYSWFTASIETPSVDSGTPRASACGEDAQASGTAGVRGRKPTRVARSTYDDSVPQSIVWRYDEDDAVHMYGVKSTSSRKEGRRFVRGLEASDRVVLWAQTSITEDDLPYVSIIDKAGVDIHWAV